jgi:hypothetical protein
VAAASDPNLDSDTFVRDTCLGAPAGCNTKTVIVSVPSTGGPPNGGGSFFTDISEDGSLVLFASTAKDLVVGDNSRNTDVFLATTGLNEAMAARPGNGPTAWASAVMTIGDQRRRGFGVRGPEVSALPRLSRHRATGGRLSPGS